MNQLPVLIRREFWEHRNTFLILPAVTTGFFLLLMMLTLMASTTDSVDITIDIDSDEVVEFLDDSMISGNIYQFAVLQLNARSTEERARYINSGLQSVGAPLIFLLWFAMFFYLLNTLYDDRRDRSILFWKSMPVSDAMTVLSKLVTGLWLVPLVYLAGVAFLQLVGLVMLSLATVGTEIPVWETIWSPASIVSNWFQYLGVLVFYSFWALPFFAWLIAVSAYAKSVPLVWAFGVPVALTIVEGIFTDQSRLADWMQDHMVPIRFLNLDQSLTDNIWKLAVSLEMVSALVVGGILVYVAIWLRGKADEI